MDSTAPTRRYVGTVRLEGLEIEVQEDGQPARKLEFRYDLHNHSPDGFAWGYEGSGPAQAALAILADALQTTRVYLNEESTLAADEAAQRYYQDFKRAVIARLPLGKPFELPLVNVLSWFRSIHGDWSPGVYARGTCPHGGTWGRCDKSNCIPF